MHSFTSDSSVEMLLGIFRFLIYLLHSILGLETVKPLLQSFPSTMYLAKKHVGNDRDEFEKFVVCQKCHSLCSYEDAVKKNKNGDNISSKCKTVPYPNHPHQSRRKPCGTRLMKKVLSLDGKKSYLYPKKVYCYRTIKGALEQMLTRPGFKELLLHDKCVSTGCLSDIYDANLWNDFKSEDGTLFFSDKRNLGFMLNVDWFQPYKNTEYSLGVIYMALLNLPRQIRFKWENVLVCGIIPGPQEPKLNINTYLKPLVDELCLAWNGMLIKEGSTHALYRMALVCLSSDVPATRKCGGFLSFNAEKGIFICALIFDLCIVRTL